MKILLVSPLPPPMGGIATLTKRMINNLSSSEIEFECVNIAHKVSEKNNNITKYNKIEPIIILFRTIFLVLKKCKNRQCDIIHVNSSSGDGTVRDYLIEKIAKWFKLPVVLHYHCNLEDAVLESRIAQKYYVKCFALANKIIVLNKITKDFVKKNGYDSTVIPNGVPENLIASEHLINSRIKTVVFTGRVSEQKGCLEIYDCARQNPQIVFYLAGLIDREIELKLKTVDNIVLLGALTHSEVIKLLDKADVFLFPTYSEGFSVSLLEAMARGLPCITTSVGANKEMIENSGGVIVEPKESKDLIKAISLLENPGVRREMSNWNLNKVLRNYTEERMFEMIVSTYTDILKNI